LRKKILISFFLGVLVLTFFSASIFFDKDLIADKRSDEIMFEKKETIEVNSIVTQVFVTQSSKNSFFFDHDFLYTDLNFSDNSKSFFVEEIKKVNSIRNPSRNNVIVINLNDGIQNLKLSSSTGNINVTNIFSDNANVRTSTGRINVSNSNFNNVVFSSSTGNITVTDSTFKETNIKVSTANTSFENCVIEKLDLNSSTGNLNITNSVLKDNVYLKTSTGNIYLKGVDLNKYTITFESSTGSIKTPEFEAKKSAVYGNGVYTLKIVTSTGNVIIQ